MPKFLVTTVSTFRHSYIVDTDNATYAKDFVTCTQKESLDQEWIGDHIVDALQITEEQLTQFLDTAQNGHIADELILREGNE